MPEWVTKYWVEWVFGLVTAGLLAYIRSLSAQIKKERREQQALRDGMRSLLKAQIIETCERAMRDGYCGARLRDIINDMYSSYHALDGNGTVTSIVEQTMELPAVKPDERRA